MMFEEYLARLRSGQSLNRKAATEFIGCILDDDSITDGMIAEALTMLKPADVTADMVSGFVDCMRQRMVLVPDAEDAIDTCGTGGDRSGTFNISTAAAIVLAAAGIKVAKHGNRAATSKCGSAEVLEASGIPIDLSAEQATTALHDHGFVFLFAPQYHPSFKRLAAVRKQLGFPTVFNLLGPLLNPARVKRQIIGTFSQPNAELLAAVMSKMDYEKAIVLASRDGLDEASLSAPVGVWEIKGSQIEQYQIEAADYSLASAEPSKLKGGDAAQNAAIIRAVFQPTQDFSAQQRIVIFNAGLGFYVAGVVKTIAEGIQLAGEAINSGKAMGKLKELHAGNV